MAKSLIEQIEDPDWNQSWLQSVGIGHSSRALSNLKQIVSSGLTEQSLDLIIERLPELANSLADPDRAINNLERFTSSSPELAQRMLAASERFDDLVKLFSDSQYLSDCLIREPETFEVIWQRPKDQHSREQMVEDLTTEIGSLTTKNDVMKVLRQFKRRHTFRIGVGDLISNHRVELVTQQISLLASTMVESAYRWARRDLVQRLGEPLNTAGQPCPFVVLAMGKLGGLELNYSSDIDLVMAYQESGTTAGRAGGGARVSNQEFFERLCQMLVKLLNESTAQGAAYRVDLRLRPNGASGKICSSFGAMIRYYDLQGRTWERQALIKARPIAGDLGFGESLLDELAPWIFHRNLNRADISGIKALKRKIERRALASGEDRTNVKTGHGGIRDVEFIIQFMQLLHGGDLPSIRTTNTLEAIRVLEQAQILSTAESTVLAQNYCWLRRLEHRLQMMFDLQTHTLPTDDVRLEMIAKRMGFVGQVSGPRPLEQFQSTLNETTESNRKILDHLLHGAFGMAFGSLRDTGGNQYQLDQQEVPLEVDLILDPDPDPAMVKKVLEPYGFRDPDAALRNLMELAKEPTPFLSDRRCKHFLASVAPSLLSELSRTPDPDASLVTLSTVSDCLGAKGVLWELFRFNPPTLSLYVRLCASSDYLVGILKSNPGMIDELVDALQLEGLPSYQWLETNMEELCKGAEDPAPIIHSFKNTQHMRVGVRDLLGRDDIRDTHRTLSDVAEICLRTVAKHVYAKILAKYADPTQQGLDDVACPLVILGLGKLGGREPNYHSDLDVIFLYPPDSPESQLLKSKLQEGTTLQFFFSELAAAITQFVSQAAGHGRLYELDSRLRPTGKSGSLAVSTDEFQRYFDSGQGQLWERQALCKARPVFGTANNSAMAMELVRSAILANQWQPEMVHEIWKMRIAMQDDRSAHNLKRGVGGTVDVEFAIQMLQLKHASEDVSVLVPGTLPAIERLSKLEFLNAGDARKLAAGYQLLRSVEARLRLMNTTARHDLPRNDRRLNKLAYLLNYPNASKMVDTVEFHRNEIRTVFVQMVGQGNAANDGV